MKTFVPASWLQVNNNEHNERQIYLKENETQVPV